MERRFYKALARIRVKRPNLGTREIRVIYFAEAVRFEDEDSRRSLNDFSVWREARTPLLNISRKATRSAPFTNIYTTSDLFHLRSRDLHNSHFIYWQRFDEIHLVLIETDTGHLPALSLCSTSHSLRSMPNMADQAPKTTVTRSVVYETVTMYIPQRELWMRAMPPATPRR